MQLIKISDRYKVHIKSDKDNLIINVMCLDPAQGF
jgi:hypothetical protein